MTQWWKLNGYCPECNRSYVVMESEKIKTVTQHHDYYTKMFKDNRPTLKCQECGAHYEAFIVKAVYTKPVKQQKGVH